MQNTPTAKRSHSLYFNTSIPLFRITQNKSRIHSGDGLRCEVDHRYYKKFLEAAIIGDPGAKPFGRDCFAALAMTPKSACAVPCLCFSLENLRFFLREQNGDRATHC